MSFLSILLVASAFYFAHARPDTPSWPEVAAAKSDAEPHPYVPSDSDVPVMDPKDYKHQLYGFMNELSETVDKYMTPLMSKMDVKKQDELKNMGMNGFASYVNYLLLLIEEKQNANGEDAQSQNHGDSFPRNEMILQFESLYPLDPHTPYMAETEVEEFGEE